MVVDQYLAIGICGRLRGQKERCEDKRVVYRVLKLKQCLAQLSGLASIIYVDSAAGGVGEGFDACTLWARVIDELCLQRIGNLCSKAHWARAASMA